MSVERLLLLMTTRTYRAGAFLAAARRLEAPVVVGSERRQALDEVSPGQYLTLDFSAPERAVCSVVEFAVQFPIGAVIAADDDGVVLAAKIAAALGLRHNSETAVRAARDKHRMRQILEGCGIRSPRFELCSLTDDPSVCARGVDYPAVLKPVSLSASRGVIRADDADQFVVAFRRIEALLRKEGADSEAEILVESFIPGAEVALEGLLTQGELTVLALFDKPDPLDGPFFEESIYVTPSCLAAPERAALRRTVQQAVQALCLREGPVHVELRLNDQGAWIVEIAPRSIGGLCSKTLRFGAGISLEELILQQALGQATNGIERESCAAGVMMIPIPHGGTLRQVDGRKAAQAVSGVEEVHVTIPLGHEVVPWPEGSRYLGFIFAREEEPEAVVAALRSAHGRLRFEITPAGWTQPMDREMTGCRP